MSNENINDPRVALALTLLMQGSSIQFTKDLVRYTMSQRICLSLGEQSLSLLWLTRPPHSPLPRPTSVPGKLDTGYDIDQHGVLRKNPPMKHVPSCFYDVPREETCYTTLKYKGNFWSRMTGRTDARSSSNPGPGYYEHETTKTAAQIRDERIREAKRGTAKQLRFLDILSRRKLLENFPAPNSYNVKGNFDRFLKIACKCDPYLCKLPPFGQSAKRFDYKRKDLPGPGAYDPEDRMKCVTSICNAPFGSFSRRFHKITVEPGPAPNDYHTDVGNLAYESQKRFKQTSKPSYSHKSFNTISTLYKDEEDSEITNIPKRIKQNRSKVYHAAFKSKAARFPAHKKVDVPDPGAYDVLTAFKANRDKCDYLSRRLPAPFGSRASRFPKTLREHDVQRPDPTTYDVAGDISSNVAGGVISFPLRDPRKPKAPGPARYCVRPS
nr:sperm-tail PG-rich repeat-containing protein 2-like [Nomia melanderi]